MDWTLVEGRDLGLRIQQPSLVDANGFTLFSVLTCDRMIGFSEFLGQSCLLSVTSDRHLALHGLCALCFHSSQDGIRAREHFASHILHDVVLTSDLFVGCLALYFGLWKSVGIGESTNSIW